MAVPLTYEQAFEAFLDCTDEKSVLLDYFSSVLKQRGVATLLDIGPGNGDLSVPLANLVDRYVAVEPISAYVAALRQRKLMVIQSRFPTSIIREKFDLVLASYVISLTDTDLKPFVEAAWKLVNPDGALVIAIHQGTEPSWQDLVLTLKEDNLPYHRAVYQRLVELLQSCGRVERRVLTTQIQSSSLEKMVAALGFVWSDGDKQLWLGYDRHDQEVAELLRAKYCHDNVFCFPFEHTVLTTTAGS